jgi:hypothetical protein
MKLPVCVLATVRQLDVVHKLKAGSAESDGGAKRGSGVPESPAKLVVDEGAKLRFTVVASGEL